MRINLLWNLLIVGWVASEIMLSVATRTRRGGGTVKDRGSMAIIWVTIMLAISTGSLIRRTQGATLPGDERVVMVAAMLLLIAGIAFRATAILMLGKAFSVNVAIREDQKIYRGGLYRWLRHPSYSGSLLAFLSVAIQMNNWIAGLTVIVPITAVFLYRIHVEEAALREAVGEEYALYSRQTWRLIPGVY